MKTYAIFEVTDYKGGELHSSVNLTYDLFIASLAEFFQNCNFNYNKKQVNRHVKIKKIFDEPDAKDILEIFKDIINKELKSEDFYATYAGAQANFTGKIYEVENSIMRELRIENYVDDIAKFILENWGPFNG